MRLLLFFYLATLSLSCAVSKIPNADFLIGTWKVEGREQYEVWEKTNKSLNGYAYRIKDGQKTISETLSIKKEGGQLVYAATVPDQNEGKTITFTLNKAIKPQLSFENLQHDFPKRIQYRKIKDGEVEVSVSGESGKGFSYIQKKQ